MSEAYAVLSNAERRGTYDEERAGRGIQNIEHLAREIIGDFLGKRRRRQEGGDVRFDLRISLSEASAGVSRRITFQVPEPCAGCGGSGAAPGGSSPCPICHGKGEIKERPGFLSLPRPCARCGGQGVAITKPCTSCGGVGTVERERVYNVKLPPGVRDGDVKILDGEGEQGSGGGKPGDLHIVVHVEPHPFLVQEGNNVVLELPIRFALAALGGVVEVPTLSGRVRMKVPPGTQSGRIFRLAGKGLPGPGGRGDQLVQVVLETPAHLAGEAAERLRAFDRSCDTTTHPLMAAFADKLRELEKGR
jgi:molecular chaperone DnaJ